MNTINTQETVSVADVEIVDNSTILTVADNEAPASIAEIIREGNYEAMGRLAFQNLHKEGTLKEAAVVAGTTASVACIKTLLMAEKATKGRNTYINLNGYMDTCMEAKASAKASGKEKRSEEVAGWQSRTLENIFGLARAGNKEKTFLRKYADVALFCNHLNNIKMEGVADDVDNVSVVEVSGKLTLAIPTALLSEYIDCKGIGDKFKTALSEKGKSELTELQFFGAAGYPKIATLELIAKDWLNYNSEGLLGAAFKQKEEKTSGKTEVPTLPNAETILALDTVDKQNFAAIELADTLMKILKDKQSIKAFGSNATIFLALRNAIDDAEIADADADKAEKEEEERKTTAHNPSNQAIIPVGKSEQKNKDKRKSA